MQQLVQNNMVKTENRSELISSAKKLDGDGEEMKYRYEFPLGGDGRYIGDHIILGRRQTLPQPHHNPNRIHPPTTNLSSYAVNSVVTVIKSATRILGRRQFLTWPRRSFNHLSPPNPRPPPYTVVVVVIAIDGTRRILVWWLSLPLPRHCINWFRPHTPPPPPYTVEVVVVVIGKKIKNDNNIIKSGLQWVDRHGITTPTSSLYQLISSSYSSSSSIHSRSCRSCDRKKNKKW